MGLDGKKGAEVLPLARKRGRPIRPYELRVHRDHGGGLWTFEDQDGQLYLAVLSRELTEHRRGREAATSHPFADSSAC